jgi:protein Mpv17
LQYGVFWRGQDWLGLKKNGFPSKFKPTIISAWKLWPIVNSVNFWFVPLQFRVLYVNVLAFAWSAYLTHVNSQKLSTTQKQPKLKPV